MSDWKKQTVRKMTKHLFNKVKTWLQSLSFRTGVIVLLCCIPFYILSFAQMLLPISAAAKGVLWTVLFGLAKTCQYGGLTILGVKGYNRLKNWIKGKSRKGMNRTIRKATPADMDAIMQVVDAAKKIMRSSGNMNQWTDGYPSRAVILSDIEKGGGHVAEDDGKVIAYFAFLPSPEPTYATIHEGEWLDDALPYHVVHRIASYPHVHHVFRSIMDFCFAADSNIRIDTHRDNRIMQHVIGKYGFTYCGIIYLSNGDERLAYQRLK